MSVCLTVGGRPNADLCARENGGCSHICTNVPGGRECSCREGFALASDGQLCLGKQITISILKSI